MILKDFTVGQTAYSLTVHKGRQTKYKINKCVIKTIGRKYVKAEPEKGGLVKEYYLLHKDDGFLSENSEWGNRAMLFRTLDAANDYIEGDMLRSWLKSAVGGNRIKNYTTNQLRTVRKALEPKDDCAEKKAFRYSINGGEHGGIIIVTGKEEATKALEQRYDPQYKTGYEAAVWSVEEDEFYEPDYPEVLECY